MNYEYWIKIILETCLIPLLPTLTGFLIIYLKNKSQELKEKTKNETAKKYIDLLDKTIEDCVRATTQTYVEALKKENAFTKEAQQKAFADTYNNVVKILSEDCLEYLTTAYKDLEQFIANKIEAEVQLQKKIA